MKLTINPMTRIEGHIGVYTNVENGKVTDSKIAGEMFRGFELFLQNRHPYDAVRITQRVCGVCHEVHGVASNLAVEDLYGIKPTENGMLIRDTILGLHMVWDHILHFYTLSLADWVDFAVALKYKGKDKFINEVKDWISKKSPVLLTKKAKGKYITEPGIGLPMVVNYLKALKTFPQMGSGIAVLGAKVPFVHTLIPGGATSIISVDRLAKVANVASVMEEFVYSNYLTDALSLASYFKEYFDIGFSYPNMFSHKSFFATGTPLYEDKVMINWKTESYDFTKIREELAHSFYNGPDTGYDFEKSVTEPNADKNGAYSWIKSARYNGNPMEVGPLARIYLSNYTPFFDALKKLNIDKHKAISTMGRILARAFEAKKIIDYVNTIIFKIKPDKPTINEGNISDPVTGKGLGRSIAARGELIHFIEAKNGKIKNYQMIMPTTWNFGPRDSKGQMGPVEKALIGAPVDNPPDLLEVGRVVRSYDPCTACSIH